MNRINGITLPENRSSRYFRAMNRSFSVNAQEDAATITIYEDIGMFGITAADMRRELDALSDKKNIELRINSPGGDVFEGIAIFNDLMEHPAKVHVKISSLAASAAAVISIAGDTVEMAKNAFFMIHNAWALTIGDKNTMTEMAEILGKIDTALLDTFADRTGNSKDDIEKWMNEETWFTADEAKESGFVDTVTGEEKAQALFDLSIYNNVPGRLKRQIEAGLRDVGFTQREAKAAVVEGFPQRDVGSGHRDDENILAQFLSRVKT